MLCAAALQTFAGVLSILQLLCNLQGFSLRLLLSQADKNHILQLL